MLVAIPSPSNAYNTRPRPKTGNAIGEPFSNSSLRSDSVASNIDTNAASAGSLLESRCAENCIFSSPGLVDRSFKSAASIGRSLMILSSLRNSDSNIENFASSTAGSPDSKKIHATESWLTNPWHIFFRTGLLSNRWIVSSVNGPSHPTEDTASTALGIWTDSQAES